MRIYNITPVPKPRQTVSDRWNKRPAVMRYRAFCDEVRALDCQVPESGAHVTFQMPMAKSWSKKKKTEMLGKPHQQKPDVDNLAKALMDAVLDEDEGVWDIRITKVWGIDAAIIISTEAN